MNRRIKINQSEPREIKSRKSSALDTDFDKAICTVVSVLTNQIISTRTFKTDIDQPKKNTEITEDQCWHHETYEAEARKCSKACEHSKADLIGNKK